MQGVSGDLVIFLSSTIRSYTRHLPALEASARRDPLATPPWMILLPISMTRIVYVSKEQEFRVCCSLDTQLIHLLHYWYRLWCWLWCWCRCCLCGSHALCR